MMKKLFNRIDRTATAPNTLIAFIVFAIVGIVLTLMEQKLKAYSALTQLDFHLYGYTASDVYEIFRQYGKEGLDLYFWVTLLDTLLPITVGVFGSLYYSYTYRTWGVKWLGNILISCALIFMVFDVFENTFIFKMIFSFPDILETDSFIGSILTQIKLRAIIVVYGFLLPTFIISIYKLIKKKAIQA